MTDHKTGARQEWLAARIELLEEGADVTQRRAGAETSGADVGPGRQVLPLRDRRRERLAGGPLRRALAAPSLPIHVRVRLQGGVSILFGDRGCGFDGFTVHLANHDVTLAAVSRAPLAKLLAYQRRMGWSFPWASSLGSDFNFDLNVSFTAEQQRVGLVEYNYQRGGHAMDATPVPEPVAQFAARCGTDAPTYARDRPGMSAFVREDGVVYHTYSTCTRGLDGLWGIYQWLDRAPKGCNETGPWWRRHDEYDQR